MTSTIHRIGSRDQAASSKEITKELMSLFGCSNQEAFWMARFACYKVGTDKALWADDVECRRWLEADRASRVELPSFVN